ncbi:MAG: hypothetical protein R3A51_13270 [Nannocystaceae bacterium]
MIEAGIPASVSTYLLCGDTQDKQENAIPVIPNETSGPSDGVVFIDSCAAPDGVGTLADEALIARNHLEHRLAPRRGRGAARLALVTCAARPDVAQSAGAKPRHRREDQD